MGCSCIRNDKENEFLNMNNLAYINLEFQNSKNNSSVMQYYQLYQNNISDLSSTDNIPLTNSPDSKIIIQDLINLLNSLPPLDDKIPVEIHSSIKYENQSEYFGETKKSSKIKHGRGIQIWIDGTKYEGYWKEDKANKTGKLIHSDGSIYESILNVSVSDKLIKPSCVSFTTL